MIKTYIKIAWRNLWKSKVQTLINITGLAVGMAAAVLIMLWVQNELSYDSFHNASDRIFRVTSLWKADTGMERDEYISLPLTEAAKKEIPEIEETASIRSASSFSPVVLSIDNVLLNEKNCAHVSNSWFTFFKYNFIAGNAASFAADPFSILMTQTAAKRYFGTQDAIGKVVRIDSLNYRVKAIIEDNPANSSFRFDVFLPLASLLSDPANLKRYQRWGNGSLMTFVRLREGVQPQKVEKLLNDIRERNFKPGESTHLLLPLKDLHFEKGLEVSDIEHDPDSKVGFFTLLAVLLLITACINYINLSTATVGVRVKEVGIRKIIGAQRFQLFKQFFTETMLIAVLALIFALVLVQFSIPFFNRFINRDFSLSFTSPPLWYILGGTLVSTVLLSSIYPALLLSSFKPIDMFRGMNMLKMKDEVFRKGLVVIQFAVSVVLIAGTIIIFKQQSYIRTHNATYNRAHVFNIKLPTTKFQDLKTDKERSTARVNWFRNIKREFEKERSIASVSFTDRDMINVDAIFSDGFNYEGYVPGSNKKVTLLNTDAEFKSTFNPELVAGRWLKNDKADEQNFVLNETAIKQLGIKQPVLGRRFSCNNVNGHIVGVVKDFHYRSLHEPIGALAISNQPDWFPYLNIKVNPGNVAEALSATEKIWNSFVPEQPLEYTFMNEAFDQLYRSDMQKAKLLNLFTGIILFVSGMGIFGMAIHASERRTREIGIRKVLGATVANITILLSKDFVLLVVIAIAFATPTAWWLMNTWLQDFAYRIEIKWWMLGFAGCLALLIAVISVSFQTIKAALANPVKSLRSE